METVAKLLEKPKDEMVEFMKQHIAKMRDGWPGCTPQPEYAEHARRVYWDLLGEYWK